MGQGPVWGLQALRGLEGGRRVGPSQAQQPVLSPGSYRATHYEETACEHLWEPDELSGLGVHGNSISLASLVPSSSGCSETGAGVGAVGEALQGSPELADTPPPSIPQPQASGASSKVLQNIQGSVLPPGSGRPVGPMAGGGGSFPMGIGEQSAHPTLQGSESKPPEPLSAAGTGGARTCPDPEGKKGAVTEPGSPRGAM